MEFGIQTNHLIPARSSNLEIIKKKKKKKKERKKKKTCRMEDLAVPADHSVKIKENEKKDLYLDLARELKQWNMKMMVIIIIGAIRTVPKGLERGLNTLKSKNKRRPSKL